ncbi:hypothetical protein VNI00_003163 [Paramarasmius palmivorus]|uniref:LIM zinc-binding domain-containing protein n=1 Tax=Paramarasmius palmivorus TaxID=297713 RepID=A0AAW0DTW7_9AGAR
MSSAPIAIPRSPQTPVPHPLSMSVPRSPEPDTVIGGEAGMAGVGRRGFAAAAQAALFIVPSQVGSTLRPNAPQFLDIVAAQRTNGTPPLTSGSHSPGFSPISSSPLSPRTPDVLTPGVAPAFSDGSKTPQGRMSPAGDLAPESSKEFTNSRHGPTDSISSQSSYGLAYADSSEYDDQDDEDMRELMRRSNSARMSRSLSRKSLKGKEPAPPVPAVPSMPHHNKNSASISSQRTVDGKENSALSASPDEEKQQISFTLRDEGFSPTTSKFPQTPTSPPAKGAPLRSNTVQGVGYTSPKSEIPKLPARSNTERGSTEKGVERKKRSKTCVRCEKRIEDGRWIQVDSGSVLCERCWKTMYLPKCRRCNLPIEKHAVSSSDGQLKGKYHKDCFNCHTCHKPFPNKTFYVYEGKPFCAYHYHEANRSLCAAPTCGQPIEGPCAVSHTGLRYHPEHMLCEYPGAPMCQERLTEYWEIDGRMLCEKHAKRASQGVFGLYGYGDDDDDLSHYGDDDDDVDDSWEDRKGLKRVTMFIDLGGRGSGIEGSDLR